MKKALMAVALFMVCGFCMAAEMTVAVNFGKGKADGWNVIEKGNGSVSEAVNLAGEKTGVSVKFTDNMSGMNKDGTKTPAEELAIPASVSKESLYGENKNDKGILEVSGLDKGKKYTFTVFASRMGAKENRETAYAISGATDETITLDAASNTDKAATSGAIAPTEEGKVTITITKGENNVNDKGYYYIGALKITEAE